MLEYWNLIIKDTWCIWYDYHIGMLILLTHCGLAIKYGVIELGRQHWFRWWIAAWRHQAITWTNVDSLSKVFCGIHLKASSKEVLINWIRNLCYDVTTHLPGTSELINLTYIYIFF